MAGVIQKFFVASVFMWIAPLAILCGFHCNLFLGTRDVPASYSATLLSGFLAVISVNIVIAFYIYMAMKEPSDKHVPDPSFLAQARASIDHSVSANEAQDTPPSRRHKED